MTKCEACGVPSSLGHADDCPISADRTDPQVVAPAAVLLRGAFVRVDEGQWWLDEVPGDNS